MTPRLNLSFTGYDCRLVIDSEPIQAWIFLDMWDCFWLVNDKYNLGGSSDEFASAERSLVEQVLQHQRRQKAVD